MNCIEVEHELAWITSDMQERGFRLDLPKAHSLYVSAKNHADKFQEDIRKAFPRRSSLIREIEPRVTKSGAYSLTNIKCIGEEWVPFVDGPFSLFDWEDFNVDSPAQRVSRLLSVGWKPKNFTKPSKTHPNGQPKFDADDFEDMDDFSSDIPKEVKLIGKYLLCRSRERLATQWIDLADKHGYVHGVINSLGAWSHRATHNNPNTANIPNIVTDDITKEPVLGLAGNFGFECRDVWIPDDPTREDILDADLTAIQLRGFAHYTGDKNYISLVSDPSVDMHSVHAEYLGGVKRKNAKTWIYAYLLGAGNGKLGEILGGSIKDGKKAAEFFMEKVPGVKFLKEQVIPKWADNGYLTGLDGRRVPVPSFHLGLAAALQSFEKIVIAHAMVQHQREWLKKGVKYRFWVHDQIVATSPTNLSHDAGEDFKRTVKDVGGTLGSLCPLDAGYNVGKTWATASH